MRSFAQRLRFSNPRIGQARKFLQKILADMRYLEEREKGLIPFFFSLLPFSGLLFMFPRHVFQITSLPAHQIGPRALSLQCPTSYFKGPSGKTAGQHKQRMREKRGKEREKRKHPKQVSLQSEPYSSAKSALFLSTKKGFFSPCREKGKCVS